jgi:hypothetical protein
VEHSPLLGARKEINRTSGAKAVSRSWAVSRASTIYVVIIFLMTSGGLNLHIGDVRITPGRVLSVVAAGALLIYTMWRGRLRYGGLPGIVLSAWLLLALTIDIALGNKYLVLQHYVSLLSGAIWFFVIVNMRLDWRAVQYAVPRVGLWVGLAGVLALGARFVGFDPVGITNQLVPDVGNFYRLRMFAWEPNVFGAIAALGLVITAPLFLHSFKRYLIVMVVLLIALLGALSKGPWLAFFMGFSFFAAISDSRVVRRYYFVALFAGMFAAMILLSMHPGFLSVDVFRSGNIDVRWVQAQHAVRDIANSPYFGNGTFSFGLMWPDLNLQFGSTVIGQGWIGQTVLGVLHDTGVFGLLLFVFFWLAIFITGLRCYKVSRRSGYVRFADFAIGILSADIVLLIQGLSTTLYSLPMYWAILGITANLPYWWRLEKTSSALGNG